MNIKECVICGEEFDLNDPRKKIAGGRINHCPVCSREEDVPKAFAAVSVSLEDKETSIKIIRPSSPPKKRNEEIVIQIGNNPRTFEEDNSGEYIEFTLDDD